MCDLVILFIHVIATLARLLNLGGIRSAVAESLLESVNMAQSANLIASLLPDALRMSDSAQFYSVVSSRIGHYINSAETGFCSTLEIFYNFNHKLNLCKE